MHLFRRQRRGPESNFRAIAELRRELRHRYSTPDSGSFIHPSDAKKVLERERIRDLLRQFPWYQENDLTHIYHNMSLIICILIAADWQDWARFKELFYGNIHTMQWPKVDDTKLPFDDRVEPFLPDNLWHDFLREQYTFCPIFIQVDSHDEVYHAKCRLPILSRKVLEEETAQGVVEKIEVDGRYIKHADGRPDLSVQVMAMKRIAARREKDFKAEMKASKEFIKCLTHHNNIMRSLGSFVHGSSFVILFPWAEGRDLNLFLYSPDVVVTNFPERSRRFSPHNLLIEAHSLAHALDFLHRGMVTETGRTLRCAHLDLKPENILVCFPLNASPDSCPVGRWKITDFGMANIEESVVRADVVPEGQANSQGLAPGNLLRELSVQPPKRGAGPFQPPEVQSKETAKVSTRRDVWSFGCILAMILAFALGGPEEVLKQQRLRARGDDYFYRRRATPVVDNRLSAPNPVRVDAEVKPNVRKWLLDDAPALQDEMHREWISNCSNLILGLLQVDVVRRPEINVAIADLGIILNHTEQLARERMWLFGDTSTAPEVATTLPGVTVRRGSTGVEGTFMGLPTNSPPSSAPSPIKGRHPSGSRTSIFKQDESVSFLNIEPPLQALNACVSSSGASVALHNKSVAFIYNLTSVKDDHAFWSNSPSKLNRSLSGGLDSPASRISIEKSPQREIVQVLLSDTFAVVQECLGSFWYLRLFANRGKYVQLQDIRLRQKPKMTKLSRLGYCAVKYESVLDIHIPGRPKPVEIELVNNIQQQLHFHGFEFSEDGAYMCLWEQDRAAPTLGRSSSPGSYHWTVWDAKLRTIGDTISHAAEPYNQTARTSDTHLIPFHSYPRFVACGLRDYIYLICADREAARVVQLGHSVNILAGLALPEDDGFVLIRAGQHEKQKAERFSLTSLNGTSSWKPHACGRLYKDLDRESHGLGIRNLNILPETPALISLTPDGCLVRKQL